MDKEIIPTMPKCNICNQDAIIFDHKKWYCSIHAKENNITERHLQFGLDGNLIR